MREALNGFVIRGISSNIPFQAALLAHRKFVAGDFNTGFIAEHYAQGFHAEDVPHDDPDFLVALAAFVQPPLPRRAPRASAARCRATSVKVGERVRGGRRWRATASTRTRRCTVTDFDGRPAPASRRRSDAAAITFAATRARRDIARPRHGQRPAVHGAGRARRGQESAGLRVVAQRHAASMRWCCRRAPPSCYALMPLQGAARHEHVPAVADAGPAGRRGGAAGPEGAGRRASWP